MAYDWLPTRDTALRDFAVNYAAKVVASPGNYSLSAVDVAPLPGLVGGYVAALATSSDPATRTKGAVVAKETAKAELIALVRALTRRVQASSTVSEQLKRDLGLPPRATRSPIKPPTVAPWVTLLRIDGLSQTIRLDDVEGGRKRAKPAGVLGAEIYFIPTEASASEVSRANLPGDLDDWRYSGQTTTREYRIKFAAEDIGKTVAIMARWINPRGQPGPLSSPVAGTVAA